MIFIGLGSNLPGRFGSCVSILRDAVKQIERHASEKALRSSIWVSAPVPVSDQPDYHNAVIALHDAPEPHVLLEEMFAIERAFDRERDKDDRNAPRTLDLDLIAYHDQIINDAVLDLPHPRLRERLFVLNPLAEIAPHWIHPLNDQSVKAMQEALAQSQKIKILEGASL